MLRLAPVISVAIATLATGPALAQPPRPAPAELGAVEVVERCAMINIGTPERPRIVKDPACGSRR